MSLLSYEFMRRAFLASLFMSIIAPMLGVFLVIRRQSLLADTLSHISLAGLALGFVLHFNPTVTTMIVVIVTAVVLEYLRSVFSTYSEVSLAILMSGGLAIALLLMNLNKGESSTSIQQYLFGSIVAISWDQVKILGSLLVVLVVLFSLLKRPLYVLIFDEDTAHVDGLPVRTMSLLFNVITGIAVALMIPIAGALLVSAIMVLPAVVGIKIGKGFNFVIGISILVGLLGMLSGLTASYHLDVPPGATIALLFILFFLFVSILQWGMKRLRFLKSK